jgi:hypothetical protein
MPRRQFQALCRWRAMVVPTIRRLDRYASSSAKLLTPVGGVSGRPSDSRRSCVTLGPIQVTIQVADALEVCGLLYFVGGSIVSSEASDFSGQTQGVSCWRARGTIAWARDESTSWHDADPGMELRSGTSASRQSRHPVGPCHGVSAPAVRSGRRAGRTGGARRPCGQCLGSRTVSP